MKNFDCGPIPYLKIEHIAQNLNGTDYLLRDIDAYDVYKKCADAYMYSNILFENSYPLRVNNLVKAINKHFFS
jgi:hypothetical protein